MRLEQRVMALDIGSKRTGVAVANDQLKTPTAVGSITVTRGQLDWSSLRSLLDEWVPSLVLVGNIGQHDPALKKIVNRAQFFIQSEYKLRVIKIDESLTTEAANQWMHEQQVKYQQRTELRDQIAACVMLEGWLESNR